jgi:alpha-galactosidase
LLKAYPWGGDPAGASLIKAGAGTMKLEIAATYSGGTIVSNGVLQLAGGGGSSGTLPNSAVTVLSGAELQLNTLDVLGYNNSKPLTNAGTIKQVSSYSETLYRPIVLNGGTITSTASNAYGEAYNFFGGYILTKAGTSSSITGVGNFGLRTSSCYFTNEAGSTLTIGCPVQGYLGTGTAPLNKKGAGRLTLAAANTYRGNTVIDQGTLALGSLGAFASSPVISLASNAVLDVSAKAGGLMLGAQSLLGSGTVAGSLSDGTNSLIAAGSQVYNTPATLTVTGDLTLNGRGTWACDIASTNTPGGGINDLVAVGGNVNLTGVTALLCNFMGGAPATNRPYLLLTNSGTRIGGASNIVVTPNGYATVLDDSNPHALYVTFTSPSAPGENTLALTPPMGWNSWNTFGCSIDETLIRQIADTMATNGMKDAGYQYVNLDDCWQVSRDASGVIVADTSKFPSGIKALADYVHSKGLKLGVYSDHGTYTCAGRPGSYGYETIDANTYAAWGVDYLKEDHCSASSGDAERADYQRMRDALRNSGRPIVFSICAWEFLSWMPTNGHLWRTTGDISASYSSMYSMLAPNSAPAFVAGPGHWNDPDMLEVGNGMTLEEDRSHFTLWCLMASPLLAGNDVRYASADTLSILTNPEVIAVNQDAAGEQGIRVAGVAGANEVWCKPLGTNFNTRAVGLFNAGSSSLSITANWTDLGLQAGPASVRDLWARTDLGIFTNSFTATVPAHGVRLLKVTGTAPVLPSLGTNYLADLQPAYAYAGWGTLSSNRSIGGGAITLNGKSYPKGLGTHAYSGVEYYLCGRASRFQVDVGVDDEVGAHGTVIFQVYADGVKLFDSGIMTGGGARQTVDVDVTGRNRLTLGVANADDDINWDHADWADARVLVTVAPQPRFATPVIRGTNLVLSGTGGVPNGFYRVLTSTNITWPPSNWSIIGTNQMDSSGAFVFINYLDHATRARFFRLVMP